MMYIYTADPKILDRLKKSQHNKKVDIAKVYDIASHNSGMYSDLLAVMCIYEQVKYVSLTRVDRVPVGNTWLDSSLFKEELYSCTLTQGN